MEVDALRVAGTRVDLGRAALEQLRGEVTAQAPVRAGDYGDGVVDVHWGRPLCATGALWIVDGGPTAV